LVISHNDLQRYACRDHLWNTIVIAVLKNTRSSIGHIRPNQSPMAFVWLQPSVPSVSSIGLCTDICIFVFHAWLYSFMWENLVLHCSLLTRLCVHRCRPNYTCVSRYHSYWSNLSGRYCLHDADSVTKPQVYWLQRRYN